MHIFYDLPFRFLKPLRRSASVILLAMLAAQQPALANSGSITVDHRLANGMRIIISEDHRAPTVAHMVWYQAGSIDEVNGKTGVAHVLEHMMFKGTKSTPGGEFSRRVAAMGGRENAFTSRDYTGYFQQIPQNKLAEVMALEADRMSNLVITKDDFEKEIKVVMEERRLRTDDQATAIVYEQFLATAYVAHPYRAPIVGWMNDLLAMTHLDAQEWYNHWYSPSNAILVVAGDVVAKDVIALAEKFYGPIAAKPLPMRKPQTDPDQKGEKRGFVKAAAENPYFVMGFKVPKLLDAEKDKEPYALEMLAAILGLDENGRLTRNVVRSARIANSAGVGYEMVSRGPSLFIFDGVPADGKTTQDVESAVKQQIQMIARDGVSEAELKRIKTQYIAATVFKRDSIFGQVRELASLEIVGFSWRDADRILEKIKQVTAQEVKDVANKYFVDDTLTVMTLLPQKAANANSAPQSK
jgi:zinc protease